LAAPLPIKATPVPSTRKRSRREVVRSVISALQTASSLRAAGLRHLPEYEKLVMQATFSSHIRSNQGLMLKVANTKSYDSNSSGLSSAPLLPARIKTRFDSATIFGLSTQADTARAATRQFAHGVHRFPRQPAFRTGHKRHLPFLQADCVRRVWFGLRERFQGSIVRGKHQ